MRKKEKKERLARKELVMKMVKENVAERGGKGI
jgi:hypothetical protein